MSLLMSRMIKCCTGNKAGSANEAKKRETVEEAGGRGGY